MKNILDDIKSKAKELQKTIVLCEGEDSRVVKAAADATKEGVAKIVLLGNEEEIKKGNERAKLVYEILSYQIKKYIGSYAFAMGGVDAIVFTGGVGENDAVLREMVLSNLEFIGIELDKNKNMSMPRGTVEEIHTPSSKVKIFRIPTDEELVIARDAKNLI